MAELHTVPTEKGEQSVKEDIEAIGRINERHATTAKKVWALASEPHERVRYRTGADGPAVRRLPREYLSGTNIKGLTRQNLQIGADGSLVRDGEKGAESSSQANQEDRLLPRMPPTRAAWWK